MKTNNLFKNSTSLLILLIIVLFNFNISGQAQEKAKEITANEQKQVVDTLSKKLADQYVFAEVGQKMSDLLLENLKNGIYNEITDPDEFASKLSMDMHSVSHDKHLNVLYEPERIAVYKKSLENEKDKSYEDMIYESLKKSNFGFEEVKILKGNIGYIKLDRFTDTKYAGATAVAVMQMVAYTDALIFDLRQNGGGSPSMIQLLTSYLYEGETRHLNSFYFRPNDEWQQFWTLPYVPGIKMPETDVYVLTSSRTFSGAEEFTYNLKNMERATIVGETTGGGAHPVDIALLNDNFAVMLPEGRAVNPISETNWEGVGVEPHISVPQEEAFDRAYILALEKNMESTEDEDDKYMLEWTLTGIKAKARPVELDVETMKSYVGAYGPRKITLEDGKLYYQREDRPRMRMIPMNEDTFMFEEIDYFRLKILKEDGKVIGVKGLYDDGRTDQNKKS